MLKNLNQGGVVVKIGYIKGKQCVVVANDATGY
jgi:acetyl-CoA carboxylase carboxyltransferase component